MKAICTAAIVILFVCSVGAERSPEAALKDVIGPITKSFAGGGHGGGGGGGGGGGSHGGGGGGGARGSSTRGFSGYRGGSGRGYYPGYAGRQFPVYHPGMSTSARGSRPQSYRPTGIGEPRLASQTGAMHRTNTATARVSATHANRAGSANHAPATTGDRNLTQKAGATSPRSLTSRNGKAGKTNWARHNPKNQFSQETQNRLRNSHGRTSDLVEARQRHRGDQAGHRHGNHDNCHHGHDWWNHHCDVIILVDGGYWGWWDGWWYPAWGYDSYYEDYPYDEPIYGYDGLPPDEAIANVQTELQRLGYYPYTVDGKVGRLTERALRRYQADQHLPVTGVID